ncbi:MAG: hypothetical protein PHS41_07325 [Victivallaceae bacterium]|nr:hypothetical protein [Victivallaceae bacterium]
MKQFFWIFMIFGCALGLSGAGNSLPAYQVAAGGKAVAEQTGAFRRNSGAEILAEKLSEKTLAANIAEADTSFQWRISPDWRRGAAGKWLFSPVFSPDGSVLAVAERVGRQSGPWATRLVFFALPSGRIVRELFFEPHGFEAIVFAGPSLIAAVECAQEFVPGTSDRIMLIDPVEGELAAARLSEACTVLGSAAGEVWVSGGKSGKIYRFDQEVLTPLGEIPVGRMVRFLLGSPDGKSVFAATEKKLLRYEKDESGQWMLADETTFDSPMPVCNLAVRRDGDLAAVVADNRMLLFCRKAALVAEPSAQMAGRVAAFDAENNLYCASARNLAIAILPAQAGAPQTILRPDRTKPRTRGEPLALLPEKNGLTVLDSFGNLYQFRKLRGKFVKELLFAPEL